MPDAISSAFPTQATTPAVVTADAKGGGELGTDTFLQLLVAQLKYQDPTSPSDSTQFLAQTAQFTMVEKLTKLAEQSEAAFQMDRNLGAAGLVGRDISWIGADGTPQSGTVTSSKLGSKGPVLYVGPTAVAFEVVTEVRSPGTAPATPVGTPVAPGPAPSPVAPTPSSGPAPGPVTIVTPPAGTSSPSPTAPAPTAPAPTAPAPEIPDAEPAPTTPPLASTPASPSPTPAPDVPAPLLTISQPQPAGSPAPSGPSTTTPPLSAVL